MLPRMGQRAMGTPGGWADDVADDEWPEALISAVERDLAALSAPRAIETLKEWQSEAAHFAESPAKALAVRRLDAICRAIRSPGGAPMFASTEATVRHAGDDDLDLPPVDQAIRLPTSAFVIPEVGIGAHAEAGSREAIDVRGGDEPLDLDLDLGDEGMTQGEGTQIVEDAEILDETPSDPPAPDEDTTDELASAPSAPPIDVNATLQMVLPKAATTSAKRAPVRRARKSGAPAPKGR